MRFVKKAQEYAEFLVNNDRLEHSSFDERTECEENLCLSWSSQSDSNNNDSSRETIFDVFFLQIVK